MSDRWKKITTQFEAQDIQIIDDFLDGTNISRAQLLQWLVSEFAGEINNLNGMEHYFAEKKTECPEPPKVSVSVEMILRLKKYHPWPIQWNIKTREK